MENVMSHSANTANTAKMNLEALVDALDGLPPSELADYIGDIVEAAARMTPIEAPDNKIALSDGSDGAEYELAAAKAIDSETLFCFRVEGEATGHAYQIGNDGSWTQCDSRMSCQISLDDLADAGDALEYCDISELCEGELTIYIRSKNEDTGSHTHEEFETQTFAITSIDDVPIAEVADRLDWARRDGLGIDSYLLEKIQKLAAK